jgi:phosphoribosylformimino-5-aminoimidazole carboxamide ribotide isomerase
MSGFTLYPALDIRAGRVVRLRQGDYAQETRYTDAALAIAQRYAAAGAGWLHLVDLDAARDGGYSLGPLLAELKASTGLRVQTGGGIRSEADVEALLCAGADRVVVGSLAVADPPKVRTWLQRFGGERIVIALDARRHAAGAWRLPVRGWTQDSGRTLAGVLEEYAGSGLRHVLCTDIARDGMLNGTNDALYRDLLAMAPGLLLQASGGAAARADVLAARAAGCAGIVVGKALLDGSLPLPDALAEAAC